MTTCGIGAAGTMDQTMIIPGFRTGQQVECSGAACAERLESAASTHEEFVLSGKKRSSAGEGIRTSVLGACSRRGLQWNNLRFDPLQKTCGHSDMTSYGESMAEKVLEEEDLISLFKT